MQMFDSFRELSIGKSLNAASKTIMSENISFEDGPAMPSTEANENAGPEVNALTQAEVDEQIKSIIAPLIGS